MATYTVKSGDTLSAIGQRLGIDWHTLKGYRSGNPNLIYPGEVLSYGAAAAPKPTSVAQVQPFLTASQTKIAQTSALPKVRTEAEIRKGLETQGLESVQIGERPEVPSLKTEYMELRQEQGVEALEVTLNELKGAEDEIIATLRQRTAAQRGRGVAANVVEGRIGEIERQERENLDFVQRQKSRVVEELEMRYNTISILMNLTQQDYTNALNDYNGRFQQNLNMINLVRDIRQEDKDDREKAIDNARANLQIYTGLIAEGKLNMATLSSSERLAIGKMEIAAGLPLGTLAKIDGRVITTNTLSNGQVQVVTKNPNGTISVQRLGTPLPPSGGGSTKFVVTPAIRNQANSILTRVDATVGGKAGKDKKLTSTELKRALSAAVNQFGSVAKAEDALREAWVAGGWTESYADGIKWEFSM